MSLKESPDLQENLESCLNPWQVKESKHKPKSQDSRKTKSNVQGTVESIGEGSAVLLPKDDGNQTNEWTISSEDESEDGVEIVESLDKHRVSEGTIFLCYITLKTLSSIMHDYCSIAEKIVI